MLLNTRFSNTKIRRPLVVCIVGARLTYLHDGSLCREISCVHSTEPVRWCFLWVVLTIQCIVYNVEKGVDSLSLRHWGHFVLNAVKTNHHQEVVSFIFDDRLSSLGELGVQASAGGSSWVRALRAVCLSSLSMFSTISSSAVPSFCAVGSGAGLLRWCSLLWRYIV